MLRTSFLSFPSILLHYHFIICVYVDRLLCKCTKVAIGLGNLRNLVIPSFSIGKIQTVLIFRKRPMNYFVNGSSKTSSRIRKTSDRVMVKFV